MSLVSQWTKGQFQSDDPATTQVANVTAISQYTLLDELINIDTEKFKEVLFDEDSYETLGGTATDTGEIEGNRSRGPGSNGTADDDDAFIA